MVIIAARTSLAAGSSADGSDPCSLAAGSSAAGSTLAAKSAAKSSTAADESADDAGYYCSLMFGKEYCLCRTCQHVTRLVHTAGVSQAHDSHSNGRGQWGTSSGWLIN